MFNRLRAALKFVKSGDLLSSNKADLALESMKEAKRLLGERYAKSTLFEWDIRTSLAEISSSQFKDAEISAQSAQEKIERHRNLNKDEKIYLQLFCETIIYDARKLTKSDFEFGEFKFELQNVRSRFRNEYPLVGLRRQYTLPEALGQAS